MSKQVGFKLLFDGTNKSINEMKEVESALAAVSAKIVSLKTDSKSILDPLIKSQTALKGILTTINKLLDEQSKSLSNSKLGKTFDETVVQKYTDKIKILKDEILKLQIELKNKPINPINLDGTKEKIQASLEQVKQLAPAFDKIATGGANNLFNKIAAIDSQLKVVNTNLKAAQKNDTGSANDQGNISQLLAQQSALIASKKLLKQESVTLSTQLTKESKNYDPTSIIGMRLELVKLEKEYINLGLDARNSAEGLEKFNKLVSLTSTVNAEEQKIGIFKRNVGNYRDAVNGLIPTLQKLSSAGLLSQKELLNLFKAENKAKVDLLQKEIDQLSASFLKLTAAEKQAANGQQLFAQLNNKISELGNTAIDTTSKFNKFGQGALSIGNVITGGLIGGGLVVGIQTAFQGIKKAIDISAEITDVQANVKKTTALTQDEVKKLTASFKNIDTRTSTKGLLEIATIAGQLGVESTQGVEAFTKAINVVTVALGDDLTGGVDQISNDLSKLSNVLFGATTDGEKLAENIGFLGNTLNVLAASGAATGDKMLEFGTRIGSTLVPLGATAAQVLALSATFDSLNINPEKGATAINNLVKDIGANIELFSKTLNINQEELRQTFNTDPIQAFNVVLKQINAISQGDKTKTLSLLKELKQSGEGVSTIFFQMGTNQKLYNDYLKQSEIAIKSTTSLTQEYEIKNNNLAGTIDKINKKIADFSSSEGLIKFFEIGGAAILKFLSLMETVGVGLSLLGKKIGALKDGILLSTDFSEVDKSIKKTFGEGLSNEFENGKFKNQSAALALALTDVRKNNKLIEKEIYDAQLKISIAKFKLAYSFNDNTIKEQESVIKLQESLLKKAKNKIVDEKGFAANFISSVAFTPDKDLTADELKIKAAKDKLIQEKIDADQIEAEKAKNDELVRQRKEKAEKILQIQKKEQEDLENLRRKFEELRIGNISDQFKKEFEKINNDAKNQITDLEKQLVLKPINQNQLDKNSTIKKAIQEIEILQTSQIKALQLKEAEAINAATQSLIKIKEEINAIIASGVSVDIQSNIDTLNFGSEQIKRKIDIEYNIDLSSLEKQLSIGEITEKQFKDRSFELEKTKLKKELEQLQIYQKDVTTIYDALYNNELKTLELKDEERRNEILITAEKEKQKILDGVKDGSIKPDSAEKQIIEINRKVKAELLEQDNKFNAAEKKLYQDKIKNNQTAQDAILNSARTLGNKELELQKELNDKKIALDKELRETIKNQTLDLASQVSDALFSIQQSRAEKSFTNESENLERERQARLKLVKGNAQEEEKINSEFDAKKKKLDKQKFEDDKKRATKEAIINGALAIIKTFATYGFTPISAALVAAQAIATGIQIAKINATTFAKGGKHSDHFRQSGAGGKTGSSTLPKDATGERPVGTATFHADEYTMPRIQTQNNSDIVEVFEDNRKALFAGRQNDLRKNLMSALIRGQKQTDRIITPKNNTFPALYQKNYFSQSPIYTNNINDSTLDSLAVKIAASVKESIVSGTMEAYEASTQKIIENTIRFNLMENIKAK